MDEGKGPVTEAAPPRMRVARFLGEGRIAVDEAPVPVPGPGELLVKVHACALCGSERGAWQNGSATIPGHEGSGTVVAGGPGATMPVGTRGALYLVAYCGRCRMCRRGQTGACLDKEKMIGFSHDGAYAEYVVVPERCLLPTGDDLSLDAANMLLDVVGTTVHAVRRSGLDPATVAAAGVMGVGPIGLGSIATLRALGVGQVFAVDVVPYRLALAERLGAVALDARSVDPVEETRRRMPEGLDLVIEATGHPTAQRQAIEIAAADGRVIIVGHSQGVLELRTSRDLIVQQKALIGSEYFGVDEFPHNLRLVLDGVLDPLPIITHRYPLERIEEAFETFWSGQTGKVLVYP